MQKDALREKFIQIEEHLSRLESQALQSDLAAFTSENPPEPNLAKQVSKIRSDLLDLRATTLEELAGQLVVSSESVFVKLRGFALEESLKIKTPLSFVSCCEGKLSKLGAEFLMNVIIPLVKIRLQDIKEKNVKYPHQYDTNCLSLQISADENEITLSYFDDGPQLQEQEAFRPVRDFVSKQSGWCSFISPDNYGFNFKLKFLLNKNLLLGTILTSKDQKIAIPSVIVQDIVSGSTPPELPIFNLDINQGLKKSTLREANSKVAIVSVADIKIGIAFEGENFQKPVRTCDAAEWFEPGIWFKNLAFFSWNGKDQVTPYLDGLKLVQIYRLGAKK